MLVPQFLQYPLYTLMMFDKWQNGISNTFIVIRKNQESVTNANIKHHLPMDEIHP
jgi:hypothetical protein